MSIFAGLGGSDGRSNQIRCGESSAQVVGGKSYDPDALSGEILLILIVLVGSAEQIEFALSQLKQFPVLDSAPAVLLHTYVFMASEKLVHGPRDTFVE